MKQVKCFPNLFGIGRISFLILFLAACQKNLPESVGDSITNTIVKSDLQTRVKSFASYLNNRKFGQLVSRTGDPLDPEDANDLVEGTMNYNYCDASVINWDTYANDTTIVVPLTNGQITEGDLDDLYDNAVSFAANHFYSIEEESKTPFVYDLQIIDTQTSTVTFKVSSIIAGGEIISPWSHKSFGSGYYEANKNNRFCGNKINWRNAPKDLGNFVNYNLNPSGNYYYLSPVKTNRLLTDASGHEVLWRFKCYGSGTTCCQTCDACSGFDLTDEYCLDQTNMNDYLDEAENEVFTNNTFFVQTGYDFGRIFNSDINRYCASSNSRIDRWQIDYETGIKNYDPHTLLQLPTP